MTYPTEPIYNTPAPVPVTEEPFDPDNAWGWVEKILMERDRKGGKK